MKIDRVSKITAHLHRSVIAGTIQALQEIGIQHIQETAGRSQILGAPRRFIGSKISLQSEPVTILELMVYAKDEEIVFNVIAEKGNLESPGMGSVFVKKVDLLKAHQLCSISKVNFRKKVKKPKNVFRDLISLSCIVQRGHGDAIARVILDSGVGVPATIFGTGTGIRDKLGLLRITIPAEKEVVSVVVNAFDLDSVLELVITTGKLDQPGRGFVYVDEIKKGMLNARIAQDYTGHAASIEQIISAIDHISGDVKWRRKTKGRSKPSHKYLHNLVDLAIVCDEGREQALLNAAMRVGAPGATLSKARFLNISSKEKQDESINSVSPARQICNMVVNKEQVLDIYKSVDKAGVFDDDTHGSIWTFPVLKAFTYLGAKK